MAFTGNRAHSDYALERGRHHGLHLVAADVPVFGRKYCLDSVAVRRDSARLDFFYRRTGFPDVRVLAVVRSSGGRRVGVEFRITEGEPMFIDSMDITGLDGVPDAERFTEDLPVKVGDQFSIIAIEEARAARCAGGYWTTATRRPRCCGTSKPTSNGAARG